MTNQFINALFEKFTVKICSKNGFKLRTRPNILDPIFLGNRNEMKKKYGLDFFIANYIEAGSGLPFPKFFQKNRDGSAKGIIVVKLGELS